MNQNKFSITGNYETQGIKGFVLYKITSCLNGIQQDFERRYSDFFALQSILASNWPGIPWPCLPPKQTFNLKNSDHIELRQKRLEKYLNELLEYPFALELSEIKAFLKNSSSVETEVLAQAVSFEVILNNLRLRFPLSDPVFA